MSARETILAKLRGSAPQRRRPASLRPAVASDLVRAFKARLVDAGAGWEPVATLADVPAAVAEYRRHHHIADAPAVAPALARLDWPRDMAPVFGSSGGETTLAVSRAQAGIAETGSLVLVSGPADPTRLNFLPDHHLVVLAADSILRHLEDALMLIEAGMPRALNLVTGPSRTADIEQTLQMGAHGPRHLHVLLTG